MNEQDLTIKVGIPENKQKDIINWAHPYFKHVINKEYFVDILNHETNWDISIMLLNELDEVKGVYLLGNKQIDSIVKINDYLLLKGVEGVLLVVDESIRGKGCGNKLKDYPKTLGFDYIWGQQLKTIGNLHDWLKRRKLIAQTKTVYITLELFDMY